MKYSQKYALVTFIDPVEPGAAFSMTDWPLHITLADVFAINRAGTDIDNRLSQLLTGRAPVTTRAMKEAVLGRSNVVLLDKNDQLLALHNCIVDALASRGAVFNTPEFVREGYVPHCTIQKSGSIDVGQHVTIDTVALVDMYVDNDWRQRKVLSVFKLQS